MLGVSHDSASSAESRDQPVAQSPRAHVRRENTKNLWMPVPRVTLNDLPDLIHLRVHGNSPCRPEGKDGPGVRVRVNDTDIALFRFGANVYGTLARCPHAGGPLEVGDIEDLQCGEPCIVCPFHKYKFRVLTGRNCFPNQPEFNLETFPVKVKQGGRLFIGFSRLSDKSFKEDF